MNFLSSDRINPDSFGQNDPLQSSPTILNNHNNFNIIGWLNQSLTIAEFFRNKDKDDLCLHFADVVLSTIVGHRKACLDKELDVPGVADTLIRKAMDLAIGNIPADLSQRNHLLALMRSPIIAIMHKYVEQEDMMMPWLEKMTLSSNATSNIEDSPIPQESNLADIIAMVEVLKRLVTLNSVRESNDQPLPLDFMRIIVNVVSNLLLSFGANCEIVTEIIRMITNQIELDHTSKNAEHPRWFMDVLCSSSPTTDRLTLMSTLVKVWKYHLALSITANGPNVATEITSLLKIMVEANAILWEQFVIEEKGCEVLVSYQLNTTSKLENGTTISTTASNQLINECCKLILTISDRDIARTKLPQNISMKELSEWYAHNVIILSPTFYTNIELNIILCDTISNLIQMSGSNSYIHSFISLLQYRIWLMTMLENYLKFTSSNLKTSFYCMIYILAMWYPTPTEESPQIEFENIKDKLCRLLTFNLQYDLNDNSNNNSNNSHSNSNSNNTEWIIASIDMLSEPEHCDIREWLLVKDGSTISCMSLLWQVLQRYHYYRHKQTVSIESPLYGHYFYRDGRLLANTMSILSTLCFFHEFVQPFTNRYCEDIVPILLDIILECSIYYENKVPTSKKKPNQATPSEREIEKNKEVNTILFEALRLISNIIHENPLFITKISYGKSSIRKDEINNKIGFEIFGELIVILSQELQEKQLKLQAKHDKVKETKGNDGEEGDDEEAEEDDDEAIEEILETLLMTISSILVYSDYPEPYYQRFTVIPNISNGLISIRDNVIGTNQRNGKIVLLRCCALIVQFYTKFSTAIVQACCHTMLSMLPKDGQIKGKDNDNNDDDAIVITVNACAAIVLIFLSNVESAIILLSNNGQLIDWFLELLNNDCSTEECLYCLSKFYVHITTKQHTSEIYTNLAVKLKEVRFEDKLLNCLNTILQDNTSSYRRSKGNQIKDLLTIVKKRALYEIVDNEHTQSPNDVPNEYICPITKKIMMDPVLLADGHSYEKEAIERWLKQSNRSPKTNQDLSSKLVFPNHALKALIESFVESRQVTKRVKS